MKQRVLAVAGAVILVCSAILVRSWLVAGDDDGGGDQGSSELPMVACTPELSGICAALADAGRIASDPPTLDLGEIDAPPEGLDAWIAWDPGPRVDAFGSGESGREQGEPLGAAPLAVLADPAALEQVCPDAVTWACVADAAGAGLAVGIGDPATSEGLARLAPFPGPTGPWPPEDFDELAQRAEELRDSPPGAQSDAASMADRLVTQPGSLDVVVVPQPIAEAQVATAQGRARGLVAATPVPERGASVVVARLAGGDAIDSAALCEAASEAIADAGLTPCRGSVMTDDLAGLLFQVHDRLG